MIYNAAKKLSASRLTTVRPRTFGANIATRKVSAKVSTKDLMTGLWETPWEIRIPDAALQNPMQTFRFASVNVGSLTGRSVEVFDMLKRRKVDGAELQ